MLEFTSVVCSFGMFRIVLLTLVNLRCAVINKDIVFDDEDFVAESISYIVRYWRRSDMGDDESFSEPINLSMQFCLLFLCEQRFCMPHWSSSLPWTRHCVPITWMLISRYTCLS